MQSASDPISGLHYVLGVTNSSFVPVFTVVGDVTTPVPVLVYVSSNITLGKPPVPSEGMDLNRPLLLAGLSSTPTSLDWRQVPNDIIMLKDASNLTLNWLVLENNALGDARSAQMARPQSISTSSNLWSVMWNRWVGWDGWTGCAGLERGLRLLPTAGWNWGWGMVLRRPRGLACPCTGEPGVGRSLLLPLT